MDAKKLIPLGVKFAATLLEGIGDAGLNPEQQERLREAAATLGTAKQRQAAALIAGDEDELTLARELEALANTTIDSLSVVAAMHRRAVALRTATDLGITLIEELVV